MTHSHQKLAAPLIPGYRPTEVPVTEKVAWLLCHLITSGSNLDTANRQLFSSGGGVREKSFKNFFRRRGHWPFRLLKRRAYQITKALCTDTRWCERVPPPHIFVLRVSCSTAAAKAIGPRIFRKVICREPTLDVPSDDGSSHSSSGHSDRQGCHDTTRDHSFAPLKDGNHRQPNLGQDRTSDHELSEASKVPVSYQHRHVRHLSTSVPHWRLLFNHSVTTCLPTSLRARSQVRS